MAMTRDEHLLVILMLMKQQQAMKIVIDALKSRGILVEDDTQAFEFSQMQDAPSNAALFDQVKNNYLFLAKTMGLQTGLEHMPDLPLEFFQPPKN